MENLIYKFNAKCDECSQIFKILAVVESKNKCLDCLKNHFKNKHGIDPDSIKINEKSKEIIQKQVNAIAEIIKKES